MYYSARLILWTIAMAYIGFVVGGQGQHSFDRNSIKGTLMGAVVGAGLAFIFSRRSRRKHRKHPPHRLDRAA
jgi:uncharacterized membrane protein YfcA